MGYTNTRRPEAATLDTSKIQFADPKPDLFSETAEKVAQEISSSKGNLNKPTQLRKFYEDVLKWQEKVGSSDEAFKKYLPMIRMTVAKVAYAKGRKHVDANFEKLMRHCLSMEQLTNAKTLKHCKLFLEAFMGFMKLHKH